MRTTALDKDRVDDCFVCDSKHYLTLIHAYGEYYVQCVDGCVDDTKRPQPFVSAIKLDDAIEAWNERAAEGREYFDALRNDLVRNARNAEYNRRVEHDARVRGDRVQTRMHIDSKTKP